MLRHAFIAIKEHLGLTPSQKFEATLREETERRMIAEASLTALQVELKEALDRISSYEKKEQKRHERKKKKLQKQRQENLMGEASRSLTLDNSPMKQETEYTLEDHPIHPESTSKLEKLEEVINKQAMRRSAFPVDQRGSVNTEMRHRRLQNRLLTNRSSIAVSSVYSQARTEFSFHPSINQNTKWKPKYDDHHNHKKMWKRMHNENEKIKQKNRLKSQQRDQEELSQ